MKPRPKKPKSIMAHVDGSGTGDTAEIEVFEIVGGANAPTPKGELAKLSFEPSKNALKVPLPFVEVSFSAKPRNKNESCPAALVSNDPKVSCKPPVKDAEYEPIVIVQTLHR
jgi:hypothetical protein